MKKMVTGILAAAVVIGIVIVSFRVYGNRDNTLTINLANSATDELVDVMREEFPDIQFEVYDYAGGNGSVFLKSTIEHGEASDIVFYSQKLEEKLQQEMLLDLSGYSFVSNYDMSMLNQFDVDGHIYQLPGPVSVRCMAYNQTLFEEHGWEKPENFEELVELCKQIRREEPDITPIAMSMGGVGYPFTTVTTLTQCDFLSTPEGVEWEERYQAGEASVGEGLAQGLEMTAELIDAQAFDAGTYLNVWNVDALHMDFAKGKAAMFCVWGGQGELVELMENSEYEYGLMPFYGYTAGTEALGVNTSMVWGINKKLGEAGNEKKLQNALAVMEWLSTPEAQALMLSGKADVPTIREPGTVQTSDYYLDLWNLSRNGQKPFMIYSGYEDIMLAGGTIIQEAMLANDSTGMIEEFVAVCDALHQGMLAQGKEANSCGYLEENLSSREAVQFMASAMDSQNLGDFALVSVGGTDENHIRNRGGVSGWLYAGEVTPTDLETLRNGCGTHRLEVLTLTGEQVCELLSHGKTIYGTDSQGNVDTSQISVWEYVWAGIDVTLQEEKEVSVQLDGEDLKAEETYRVIFLNEDYTQEVEQAGEPVDTGIDMMDAAAAYVAEISSDKVVK